MDKAIEILEQAREKAVHAESEADCMFALWHGAREALAALRNERDATIDAGVFLALPGGTPDLVTGRDAWDVSESISVQVAGPGRYRVYLVPEPTQ